MHRKTIARECIASFDDRSALLVLSLLLCGDLAFIFLHSINKWTPILNSGLFGIDRDRGYPEIFQYLKFLWIIVLLIHISFNRRAPHYLSWTLVFAYFLFDDALEIHEEIGGLLATNFDFIPPFELRPKDIGELIVSATVGTFLLAVLAWAYKRGSQTFRKLSLDIGLLILLLAFFGVFIDMVHMAVNLGQVVEFILGVIEDGGEMLSVSFILWRVFLANVRDEDAGCYLVDLVRIPFSRRGVEV